jgi:hypothetical protein
MSQHLSLGVGSPSGTTRGRALKHNSNTFCLCSLHIGVRQGAAVLELGDLRPGSRSFAVGLVTTGWAPRYIVPNSFSIVSQSVSQSVSQFTYEAPPAPQFGSFSTATSSFLTPIKEPFGFLSLLAADPVNGFSAAGQRHVVQRLVALSTAVTCVLRHHMRLLRSKQSPDGRFLIRLSDSLFSAPQSDLEKNQNAVRKGLARNAQIRGG